MTAAGARKKGVYDYVYQSLFGACTGYLLPVKPIFFLIFLSLLLVFFFFFKGRRCKRNGAIAEMGGGGLDSSHPQLAYSLALLSRFECSSLPDHPEGTSISLSMCVWAGLQILHRHVCLEICRVKGETQLGGFKDFH